MAQSDINTVPKLAQRAKAEGLPISEYTIRRLIKTGAIPARFVGPKPLVSYAALVRYFSCEDGCDNAPSALAVGTGIRRIDVG
jgi:hypothetical protein